MCVVYPVFRFQQKFVSRFVLIGMDKWREKILHIVVIAGMQKQSGGIVVYKATAMAMENKRSGC